MPKSNSRGHVLATSDQNVVYCRVMGLGNMNNCGPFRRYSVIMCEKGYREFVLDFSGCDGLDSTFLGVLLGIVMGGESVQGPASAAPLGASKVVIVNAKSSVLRVLVEVGIGQLCDVCSEEMSLPSIPMQRLNSENSMSSSERINMILKAHENLCEIKGDNHRRFGRFLEVLRKELAVERKRQQSETESPSAGSFGEFE